jgi:hypothetical protein
MDKNFYKINYLGHLPFNPDLLLEKKNFRNRPVGMIYTDLLKFYWTIRSFRVDINIQVVSIDDPLSTFIGAGGTSAGIVSALGGLGVVTQSQQDTSTLVREGNTKIVNKYEKYVRNISTSSIPFEGIKNNKLEEIKYFPEKLQKDTKIKNNPLTNLNLKPTEGSLCVPGPVHKITKGSSFFSIDFSDILYFRKRYWPKIFFEGSTSQSIFTADPLKPLDGQPLIINGAIGFMSYNIPIYGSTNFSQFRALTPFAIVDGSIKPGNRCCDRFFYDGFDDIRQKECAEECGDGNEGVYTKIKTKSAS